MSSRTRSASQLEKTKDKVEDIPDKINIKVEYDEGDRPKPLRSGTTTVRATRAARRASKISAPARSSCCTGAKPSCPSTPSSARRRGARRRERARVTIVINAQGAFFDTPGDLQRLADKVNAALTAKHGMTNRLRPS